MSSPPCSPSPKSRILIGEKVNLSNLDLTCYDLTDATLNKVNLTGATLTKVNLTGATLDEIKGHNIKGTPEVFPTDYEIRPESDLASNRYIVGPKVDLTGQKLNGYELSNINFTEADFTNGNLSYANLIGANLSDAILTNTIVTGANIIGANLSGIDLSNYYINSYGYIFNLIDTDIGKYCKTTIQRNPLSGYKNVNELVSIEDCSKIPLKTVYTDNYAKHCANNDYTGCNIYKQYNSTIQNKNGNVNDSYNYSTKQYLTKRNKTYEKNAFNFVKTSDPNIFLIKDSSCIIYNKEQIDSDLFKTWRDKNQNNKHTVYKLNNSKFSQQGAVSGGSRINRLKYQTQIKAQKNNTINGAYPATRYNNGIPYNKKLSFGITKTDCNIRKFGSFQRCNY